MCSLKDSLPPFDGVANTEVGLEQYPLWDNNAKPAKTVEPNRKIRRIGVNVKTE